MKYKVLGQRRREQNTTAESERKAGKELPKKEGIIAWASAPSPFPPSVGLLFILAQLTFVPIIIHFHVLTHPL